VHDGILEDWMIFLPIGAMMFFIGLICLVYFVFVIPDCDFRDCWWSLVASFVGFLLSFCIFRYGQALEDKERAEQDAILIQGVCEETDGCIIRVITEACILRDNGDVRRCKVLRMMVFGEVEEVDGGVG